MKKPGQQGPLESMPTLLPCNLIVAPEPALSLVGKQLPPVDFGGAIMPEGFVTETGLSFDFRVELIA